MSGIIKRSNTLPERLPQEVLEFESPTAALLAQPVSAIGRSTIWLLSALVVLGIVLISTVSIDNIVSAPGRVVSDANTQILQPLEVSIVRSILVHEGQVVKKDQLLAELDPTFAGSDETQYAAHLRSYAAQVARDQAELAGKPYQPSETNPDTVLQQALFMQRESALAAQMSEYTQKIASLERAAERAETDARGYTQRLDVANQVEVMRNQLEKMQVGSRLNALAATDSRMELQREKIAAESQMASTRNDLAALVHDRDYYLQNWRTQISTDLQTAMTNESQARDDFTKAQLRHQRVDLRADHDGIVLWVAKVAPGTVLQAGDQLIQMLPDDRNLRVEVKIPGNQVGFVRVGDHVIVKLDTFSFITYGTVEGTVQSISPDSFLVSGGTDGPAIPGSSGAAGAITGNTSTVQLSNGAAARLASPSYYQGVVSIDKIKLRNLPPGLDRLFPGMTLSADIKVGRETVLTYLLDRVGPMFTQGMHEP